jgi:hypothetical protein
MDALARKMKDNNLGGQYVDVFEKANHHYSRCGNYLCTGFLGAGSIDQRGNSRPKPNHPHSNVPVPFFGDGITGQPGGIIENPWAGVAIIHA